MKVLRNVIVADAGPLIGLGRTGQLPLLFRLWQRVIIPKAVFEECLIDKARPGASAVASAVQAKHLEIDETSIKASPILHEALGAGESAAIQLAVHYQTGLLIDDKLGRRVAQNLKVPVIGIGGLLILAKQHGLLDRVDLALHDLTQNGYYLSDALTQKILKLANEI